MDKKQFKEKIMELISDIIDKDSDVDSKTAEKRKKAMYKSLEIVNSEQELFYIYAALTDKSKKYIEFMLDLLYKRGNRPDWENEMILATKKKLGDKSEQYDFDINLSSDLCDKGWDSFKNQKDVSIFDMESVYKFAFFHGVFCKLMNDIDLKDSPIHQGLKPEN